ncbi:MAG: hypothetical protein KAI07_00660, partial [Deltaproteobacteria bacterium]|nr:hypothetical protein [Deltaproteobacteria bacterium]
MKKEEEESRQDPFDTLSNPEYSRYIHKSRYARWIPEEGRREFWHETVERYINFFMGKFPGREDINWRELYNAIYNLEVMPSMRALMTAGEALERDLVAGYNPVAGDTRVVVKGLGNICIKSLVGESCQVLNRSGDWTDAVFKSYGIQPTSSVILRLNSNTIKQVKATDNHRWLLTNGRVVPTRDLKEGDRIPFISSKKPEIDADYPLGVRHGLIYGDGTATKSCKRIKGYHIRLCGKSAEQLVWFKDYPTCYPPSANGDPVIMMYDDFAATHSLKELPSNIETDSYLLGFIRGWMAADGSVDNGGRASLCTHSGGLQWLRDYSERLGFVVQSTHLQPRITNFGIRSRDSYRVNFCRSSMIKEDLLCSWKAEKFRSLASHYVVSSVDPSEATDVYCAEVPNTNTFTLEGGIVTGNCAYIGMNTPLAFDEIMYILMCGTGDGFSVQKMYTDRLPSVAEDFYPTDSVIRVKDSKLGWASAYKEL